MKREHTIALMREIDASLKENDLGEARRLESVVERALWSAAPAITEYTRSVQDEVSWILHGTHNPYDNEDTNDYMVIYVYVVWCVSHDELQNEVHDYRNAAAMLRSWFWPHELADHYRALEEREADNARCHQGKSEALLDLVDASW